MKTLIENHELKERRVYHLGTGKVYGIQDVYEMGSFGNKYITLLTYVNGSVEPEFRSHSQIDWEMLEVDEGSDIGTFLSTSIDINRQEYFIVPVEDEDNYPISGM
jgi:hypothetical protein